MQCLNCEKPIEQTEGKRQKKYCDNSCRASHWAKTNKKPKKKVIRYSSFQELESKFREVESMQKKKNSVSEPSKVADMENIDAILKEIQALSSEKMPAHIKTQIGKDVWSKDQKKKIAELQAKTKS